MKKTWIPFIYFGYLLLFWGAYRILFFLPEAWEELLLKPLVWWVPLYLVYRPRWSQLKNKIETGWSVSLLYLSVGLGFMFLLEALALHYLKYGRMEFASELLPGAFWPAIGVSLATAIVEEVSFRGYLFEKLRENWGGLSKPLVVSALLWVIIHLPIAFFVWQLTGWGALAYLVSTFALGIGSAWLFAWCHNLVPSVLVHLFWSWPLILFR